MRDGIKRKRIPFNHLATGYDCGSIPEHFGIGFRNRVAAQSRGGDSRIVRIRLRCLAIVVHRATILVHPRSIDCVPEYHIRYTWRRPKSHWLLFSYRSSNQTDKHNPVYDAPIRGVNGPSLYHAKKDIRYCSILLGHQVFMKAHSISFGETGHAVGFKHVGI